MLLLWLQWRRWLHLTLRRWWGRLYLTLLSSFLSWQWRWWLHPTLLRRWWGWLYLTLL
jgi:hypothetical protein